MSTEIQLKGDSRRRQLEASRTYAEHNGLELAEGGELEDIGISAFKGANVREGSLGRFLQAVKSGTIKPGSYLIVESLDRLSREEVLTAQSLFLSIIQSGINLVTLADGRVYRPGKTELADLIMSLVVMSRAHEESQMKSLRITAAWKNKRTGAGANLPMTKWCPAWLTLSPDRKRYVPIPERVAIVRQIFQDTVDGVGMYSVALRLNKTGVPTFGGPNGWHQSYISKILANRAAIGEFQPHVRVDGKRVSTGEPIASYFPAIVDDQLFYQAGFAKSQRRQGGAGRKGPGFANLFSGVAKCSYCGSQVLFENKGDGRKGGTYLICDGTKRGRGCPSVRWRYRDFEASFLAFVQELDVESIINATADSEKRKAIDAELDSLKGELSSVSDLMEKTYAVLSSGGPVDFVTGKLNELTSRKAELSRRFDAKMAERQDLSAREERYQRSKDEIGELVGRLQKPASNEIFKLRAQIASQIKVIVKEISVAPLGNKLRMRAEIERLETLGGDTWVEVNRLASLRRKIELPKYSQRHFAVHFHNEDLRVVYPRDDDPLQFNSQFVSNSTNIYDIIEPDTIT